MSLIAPLISSDNIFPASVVSNPVQSVKRTSRKMVRYIIFLFLNLNYFTIYSIYDRFVMELCIDEI